MNELIITTIISSVCTGGLTWLFTLKYTRKQAEADAMKSLQEVYKGIIEDLKTDREENRKEIEQLTARVKGLEQNQQNALSIINEMQPFWCGTEGCMGRKVIKQQKS